MRLFCLFLRNVISSTKRDNENVHAMTHRKLSVRSNDQTVRFIVFPFLFQLNLDSVWTVLFGSPLSTPAVSLTSNRDIQLCPDAAIILLTMVRSLLNPVSCLSLVQLSLLITWEFTLSFRKKLHVMHILANY